MKIKLVLLLTLTALFIGLGVSGTCDAREFGKRIIKHRAKVGGDCENPNHCVGIVGNKLYNYQNTSRRGKLINKSSVTRGKLRISRQGVEIGKATREEFGLTKGEVRAVRSVHQYVGIKRDVKGSFDGKVLDIGTVHSKNNRKVRNIENIVEVKGGIKSVSGGNMGQVILKKSKMRQISSYTTIDGRIDLKNRHSLSIGGVVIENGTVTDGIKSNVIIKGR